MRTFLVDIPARIVSVVWTGYIAAVWVVSLVALAAAAISAVLGFFGLPPL